MEGKNNEIIKRRSQLSPTKQAILEKRLRGESEYNQAIFIPRRTQQSPCPLSFPQQRLWFIQQLEPQNSAYNEFACLQLRGTVNFAILEKSFNEILKRHESLRTSFETLDGQPSQVIHPAVTLKLPVVDLRNLPSASQDVEVEMLTAEIAQKPFDLAFCPLLRVILLQISEDKSLLLLVVHHIVCDGWSIQLFNQELAEIYKGFLTEKPSALAKLPIQYADYSIWQHQWLQGEREKTQLSYWKQQLADAPTTLSLPTDRQRPLVQSFKGAVRHFKLSSSLTDMLRSLSKEQGVTLFMTLLAAFQVQLYRYTGQEDICIGSPIANRNHTDIERLIGFFVNTLVLRTDLSGNPSFLELLNRVREVCVGAYAHADLPFERLVGELYSERNLSHNPLFQVMFVLQEDNDKDLVLPNLTLKWLQNHSGRALFDLTLNVVDAKSELWGYWEYNTDLFDAGTIERMVGHFTNLLEDVVSQPEKCLSDLPLLTEPERQALLVDWNNTATDYPQDKCIHELFETQVEKTPDAVAVVFENQQLSYRELNTKANQLAHYLRSLGVKPEVLVGICVERSLSMVIGLLAILKAGGAYVPLDPNYPQERLAYILEDSQPSVLLTQQYLLEKLPNNQAQVICIDNDWEYIAKESIENPISNITPDNLAYVIYTSGSTGKPKGAMNAHRGISNRLLWMQETYQLTLKDAVLQKTPFSFDVSVWEFFWTLMTGARLVVAQPEGHKDTNYLVKLIRQQQITTLHFVPSMLQVFIEAEGLEKCQSLVRVIASGEALPAQLPQRFFNKLDAQLHNLYGPTETAVDVTFWQCKKDNATNQNTVPIGQPIANIQIYLLDKYLNPVPVGVTGEVYIGGVGVGRGYLNRPDLTAEKFIPNPFSQQTERLYKTGDKALYLANGDIEYIGRIDNQVKLRGFRIELGEIEAIISQYPTVRETVAVVSGESVDSQRIVAYIVPQIEQTLTVSELRGFLEAKLPSYMIPAAFVTLEALPLTPNGKVDRKALPAPEFTQVSSSNIIPPSTTIENLLAGIWSEILGIEQVGISNNFFELGGHSLIATRVISQIRQVFQVELPLRYLFEKPTIAGLAKEIEKAIKVDSAFEVTNIEQIERTQELPLSFAQQRLWFLAQLEPDSPFYNIPAAVRLQGQLNVEALQESFNEIVNRHEALRTNFQTREGQAVAVISQEKPITLSILDISNLEANQQQAEIKQQAAQAAQQPFDISSDHLLRVKLLRLSEQEHIVLLTMHHIVSDGWSIGVLVEELATLYQAFCQGQFSPLPTLPIQYVDFAGWQRQWLQGQVLENQISYWLKQLENAPKVLELPTDYPRPAIQTYRGATYSFELSKELSASLNKLSQQQGSTLFMTLLASFQILLWRYTGQQDIVVGSPIANRNRAEIEGLIGFFVNTLVLRTSLVGNPRFEELLKRVREVALGAYAHQDLPFELLVEQMQPQRSLSHAPLFQVMFVLQNAPMSGLELPGLTLTQLESDSGSAQFDLTLYMTETESGLVGSFEYNTDLFAQSSIQRMVGHLQTLLEAIVANPQRRLSDLPLLTEFEQYQLLRDWNDTEIEYPQDQCIHELFEAQVDKTPDAVAVVFENQQLSYRELNQRANQLAHYLQKLGVKPEVLVGICVERSLSMIIGLLAIFKAGGGYVPLDPSYPIERIAFILEETQAPVLLTKTSLVELIPQHQAEVVCLDSDWHLFAQHSQENLFSELTTENLAYTIYTSGSTGKPKGVQIPHIALSNFLHSMKKVPGLTSEDTLLAVTTYSFDIAALELFLPIIVGARLVIGSREVVADGNQLSALLVDSKATVMQATPATWQLLLAAGWDGNRQLKILCGGEALPGKLANQLLGLCDCVWNMYGPTETTIWSAASQVETVNNTVPISSPIANTQLYILDKYHQLVPVGVIGELCIGGEGLARGYFHRPDLTAEKFIPNPFSDKPARLYRTGDLARYLANGDIEYIGRIDNQVKLRGFRIELGEIQTLISQHPEVRETVVVVHASEADSQRIVAYVVPKTEQAPTISELRGFLEAKLPSYMIPAAFVSLEALPLTPNGKVDRKALPIPDSIRPQLEVVYQPPQTEIEKTIADIWQNLLKLEDVGIHDNFFELGGHSLLLVQVHSNLRQIFKRDISVLDLFRYPTINSLTNYFNQTENQQISDDIMFDINERIADGKAQQRKRLQKIKSGEII
ncbi:MAG: amino acid adenylation domain-containing protein [Tolypothrix brevis GSE-NOS-MK-07-07A]|jgi:amino acid adenylation domain-containing protein|nr:amino acid adenylation domain-containing protein [Tolypothrix brevis GSE-NOS-MK-07-07A]